MILLLDTTVLIDVLRAKNGRAIALAALVQQGHTLGTTAINIAEVYAGMRPHERVGTDSLLEQLEVFPLTFAIARRAGEWRYNFAREGKTLELPDLFIAAAAVEYGLTLVTDNHKHFPLPELRFYDLPLASGESKHNS